MLISKNLIKELEPGKWVRKVLDETTGLCRCVALIVVFEKGSLVL